jgi:glutamate carboxypeptidase
MRRLPADLSEAVFQKTLDLLVELTRCSSPSGDKAGLLQTAEILAAALAPFGLACGVVGEGDEKLPVLYARGPRATESHLLLIGHLDTVLPALPPEVTGDRLVATGAIDMKGGLAAFAGALSLLAERGVKPPDDLLLVCVPDEEVGGPIAHEAATRWGEQARAFWVLEPGEPASRGAETLVVGRRGLFTWRFEATGRASHSGLAFWEGRSALDAAARFAATARALSVEGGPTVNPARLVAGEAAFVDDLRGQADFLGTERQLNVVPDRAVVEGEARFLRTEEVEGLSQKLTALAAQVATETDTEVVYRRGMVIPPVDPHGPHRWLVERAVAAAERAGWKLELEEERGGVSFPNFLPDPARIPVLDGLGPVGGGMHTREEYVELESLARRIVLLADLLAAEG